MYKGVTRLEFLQLVKVVKMLYGKEQALKLLEKNLNQYYNIDSASLTLKKDDSK